MKGYINQYSHLEKWFRLLETSAWNLYRGHVDKLGDNRSQIIYKQDNKSMPMDESWDMLRDLIEINAANGGHFTIYVPSMSHNVGANVFFVAPNTLPAGGRGHAAALAGFEGISGGVSKTEVQELIERERKMWELERTVEDLAAAQEANVGAVERFFTRLLDDGTLGQIAIAGLGLLSQKMGINPAQVSMAGFDTATPTSDDTSNHEEDEELSEEEVQFAVELVDRFRPHFESEAAMRAYLLKVADFFDKNTAAAKAFFK